MLHEKFEPSVLSIEKQAIFNLIFSEWNNIPDIEKPSVFEMKKILKHIQFYSIKEKSVISINNLLCGKNMTLEIGVGMIIKLKIMMDIIDSHQIIEFLSIPILDITVPFPEPESDVNVLLVEQIKKEFKECCSDFENDHVLIFDYNYKILYSTFNYNIYNYINASEITIISIQDIPKIIQSKMIAKELGANIVRNYNMNNIKTIRDILLLDMLNIENFITIKMIYQKNFHLSMT